MTFYSWLRKQRARGDAIGDLGIKAGTDEDAPKGVQASDYRKWIDWVQKNMRTRKGAREAINTVDRAFYEWMYDEKKELLEEYTK